MELPIPVRRLIYRTGFRVLQLLWLLRRPRMDGVKCVIADGDRVLLVRHTYGSRWWDLPGGGIHRGEPPLTAARREMREELGIEDADWQEIGELAVIMHHRRDTLHCFHVDLDSPALTIDRGEINRVAWFLRSALPYNLAPHVISIVARTTVQRRSLSR